MSCQLAVTLEFVWGELCSGMTDCRRRRRLDECWLCHINQPNEYFICQKYETNKKKKPQLHQNKTSGLVFSSTSLLQNIHPSLKNILNAPESFSVTDNTPDFTWVVLLAGSAPLLFQTGDKQTLICSYCFFLRSECVYVCVCVCLLFLNILSCKIHEGRIRYR